VDSPYEVHDYVRAYLGDTPEAKEFAKMFLERRAKQNGNQQNAAPQNQPPAREAKESQKKATVCFRSFICLLTFFVCFLFF